MLKISVTPFWNCLQTGSINISNPLKVKHLSMGSTEISILGRAMYKLVSKKCQTQLLRNLTTGSQVHKQKNQALEFFLENNILSYFLLSDFVESWTMPSFSTERRISTFPSAFSMADPKHAGILTLRLTFSLFKVVCLCIQCSIQVLSCQY